MNKKYKNDAFEAIHSSAYALHRMGVIHKATMREFDQSCLEIPLELFPEKIKAISLETKISQEVSE